MKTTNKRKLNRLIRECYEEGYGEIEPVSMALLTIEEIIDLIMITVAALKSEDFVPVISEEQKEKVKRKLYEANNKRRYRIPRHSQPPSHTPPRLPNNPLGSFLFSHLHYSSVISPQITEQDTHHCTIYFT